MMRNIISILLCVFAVASAERLARGDSPQNSKIIYQDSIRLDSTETILLPNIWVDNGSQIGLLVECRDDSADGFADDSASARIKLYQTWPLAVGDNQFLAKLNSHAHPDSTTVLNDGGADFVLWDSLDILDMDTAAVYLRNHARSAGGGLLYRQDYWGDSLATLQTSGFGAFAYKSFSVDYSPSIALEITGNTRNKILGVGSVWIFRVYQLVTTK